MLPAKRSLVVIGLAYCLLYPGTCRAGIVIGPGNTPVNFNDTSFNLLAIDENAPVTLAAGTYMATSFNYAFVVADSPLSGTIQPLLLIGSSPSFTTVALGDAITYTNPTSFTSQPFGGSDTFTLASSETVYAGVYWTATTNGEHMPIGFEGTGSTYLLYNSAAAPVVGSPVSGDNAGTFSRTYDFSISVSSVPEPSSLGLAGAAGLIGLTVVLARRLRSSVG